VVGRGQRAARDGRRRHVLQLLALFARVDEHRVGAALGHAAAAASAADTASAEQPAGQALPRADRLAGPYPHAGRDSHHQRHEVFEHEHGVYRLGVRVGFRAWARQVGHAVGHVPGLVVVAPDDDGRGNGVQDADYADADHELLQLVRLAAAHLLLDDVPDAEQRHEPAQQERYAQRQVDDERCQDEHF